MTSLIVEIVPKSVRVEHNGLIDSSLPVSAALLVSWIRPNENQEVVTGQTKNISLRGTQEYTHFPLESVDTLLNNQLIKTKVIGKSVLKAELLVTLKPSIFHKLFASLFGAATNMATVTNPFASALYNFSSGALKDAITENQISSLGQGLVKVDGNNLPDTLNIDLKLNRPLYSIDEIDQFDQGDELETRALLLEADTNHVKSNGSIVLGVNVLN